MNLCNGGATVDYAIRCELFYRSIFKKNKNIYWNYHEESAEVNWLDEENIVTNGRKLNILTDSFDFRYNKQSYWITIVKMIVSRQSIFTHSTKRQHSLMKRLRHLLAL
ncbi:DUF5412 family protein [Paenibacillus sp. N3.4]|uniref:DUF5412 family protein n=1 Tax=Paenibacillus sp. N3.4 TaxID=2603222 RepID=UPI00164EE736